MRAVSFTWAPGLATTTWPAGFCPPAAVSADVPEVWLFVAAVVVAGAVVAAAAGSEGPVLEAPVPDATVLDMALLAAGCVARDAAWTAAINPSISPGRGGRSPGLTNT